MTKLNLNAKRWYPYPYKGLIFGTIGVMTAFVIRYGLQPFLETGLPLFFFQINTIIITFFFGIASGFFTFAISLPIIIYFFLEPFNTFTAIESRDIRIFIVYISYTLISGVIIEWLRRSQYSHRLELLVSKTLSKQLIENSQKNNN